MGQHGETLVADWGLAKAPAGRAHPGAPDGPPCSPASTGGAETLPGARPGTRPT